MMKTIWTKSLAFQKEIHSLLCVGLDPDPNKIPEEFARDAEPLFQFCRSMIDATSAHVCAFKPQIAFFAATGREAELEKTISYIKQNYPKHLVILDAKRGDIGNTAAMYAKEAFTRYQADTLTVNPYMGWDSLEPYLQYKDRGIFALCRTSNPGSKDLQELQLADGSKLYQHVAAMVESHNAVSGNVLVGMVVGATQETALTDLSQKKAPLLIPGIGAQGGNLAAIMQLLRPAIGQRPIYINVSRDIIFATNKASDLANTAAAVAKRYHNMMW